MARSRFTTLMVAASMALAAALVPSGSASAARLSEVNFDGGTAGTPCAFADVNPLREKYAGFGIHFRGPDAIGGGAILDQCSGFGVPARSGRRFLAFNGKSMMNNGGVPQGPERISFDRRKKVVRIFVSQGTATGTATFRLIGKRAGRTVRTATATTTTSAYSVLVVSAPRGMNAVVLSAADPNGEWVADDLAVRN